MRPPASHSLRGSGSHWRDPPLRSMVRPMLRREREMMLRRQNRLSSRAVPSTLPFLLLLSIPSPSSASQSEANQWQLHPHLAQQVAAGASGLPGASIPENGPWGAAYRLSECNDSVYHSLVWPLAQVRFHLPRVPLNAPTSIYLSAVFRFLARRLVLSGTSALLCSLFTS